MESITHLVERELLARRSVALPFVGILLCQRVGAIFAIDRSHLTPPRTRLTLTPDREQDGADFIELIARQADIAPSEAIESYNEWLTAATDLERGVLTIETVCSIDLGSCSIIDIDAQFEGYLAPMGTEPLSIGRPIDTAQPAATQSATTQRTPGSSAPRRLKSTSTAALTLSIIAIAAAALYIAYFYLTKYGILTI